MKIKESARAMEARLEFFNRQTPEIQAELIRTGYFRRHADGSTTPPSDALAPPA